VVDVGVSGSASLVVSDADTAIALGSGDVPVLGTPRVVALCEAATVAALRGKLADGETSVGSRVELDHLRPSYDGATVTASATLDAVDGRRLDFRVEVAEGDAVVARGRVVRVVVDAERFSPTGRKTSDG
jgi:fluoroacetyl-CoA thioesterase